jgi:hypothetical protein
LLAHFPDQTSPFARAVAWLVEEDRRAARAGLFWAPPYEDVPEEVARALDELGDDPLCQPYVEAWELAERIDAFLATLEGGGQERQLARDCRSNLDMLLVLADWCSENGRPRSAAEAYHLHGLVRSLERADPAGVVFRERAPEGEPAEGQELGAGANPPRPALGRPGGDARGAALEDEPPAVTGTQDETEPASVPDQRGGAGLHRPPGRIHSQAPPRSAPAGGAMGSGTWEGWRMPQKPLSLADFLLRACDGLTLAVDYHLPMLAQVINLRARAALAGQFCLIGRRHSEEISLPPNVREALDAVEGEDWWEAFQQACELVERVDGFLAALEQGGPGHQVARDCRGDLNLLPVLADWCDDNGRPASAAEARHLYRLIDSLDRDSAPAGGTIVDFLPEFDSDPGDEPDEYE